VAVLLVLLGLLATLQYRWLGQISDGERVRMSARVQDDTKRFADDFNREIQTVYFSLQTDAESFETGNWNGFNNRFIDWSQKTNYPELIKDLYFIKKGDAQTVLRFDPAKGVFETSASILPLDEIKKRITENGEFTSIDESQMALVMPIFEQGEDFKRIVVQKKELITGKIETQKHLEMPGKYGFLVILLDENVIRNQILPNLVDKYFSGGESGTFSLSVVNTKNESVFHNDDKTIESGDSSAKLFNLKPSDLTFIAEKVENSSIGSQMKGTPDVKLVERVTNGKVFPKSKSEILTVNIEGGDDIARGKPRISIFQGNGQEQDGIWTLNVQHTSGSLEKFIANTRNKNLAISFGILSLLAVSMILIFVSSQRAKALAQRQVDFVSSVSHEFRTPLSVIYSAGENLSDGVVSEQSKVSNYGKLIKSEGKKLTAMVEQILEFAGAKSGNRKYDFRDSNAKEIIDDAVAECQPLIDQQGFELEKDIADNLPIITSDSNALSHAIQNLLINSIKYSNGNRWLKISAKNGGDNLQISVEDKGIGISKKDLSQIFEPFFRSETVVDEQIHGNGLGLSLVKQIVEAHKGKIEVESTLGKGSSFSIKLPYQKT
jgi:signal transduction histidine kinase